MRLKAVAQDFAVGHNGNDHQRDTTQKYATSPIQRTSPLRISACTQCLGSPPEPSAELKCSLVTPFYVPEAPRLKID